MRMLRSITILLLLTAPAYGWNALGHKLVCDIAWQELEPEKREKIVEIMRRHPRFAEDFLAKKTADVADEPRWIFQHAGTWPDICRGGEYDRPTWHYINRPLFIERVKVDANLSTKYPDDGDYNVAQAMQHCLATIDSDALPDAKALAYCWLFHLVGDVHQPCHSTALFGDYFPNGDRGGNSIPLARGDNLHSLWDNLLGRRHYMRNVEQSLYELKQNRDSWKVATHLSIPGWIAESHKIAKDFAYDPIIIEAVKKTPNGERIEPISLPEEYLKGAGKIARERIVAAGLRLGALLND